MGLSFYIRAALPQIRVETLIGSQANYEIKIQITIYFYKIIISHEKYSTLNLYWYFCSLGPHLEKTIKMFTYDDQTSHGVSTIPVLRVCTCHVIKNNN